MGSNQVELGFKGFIFNITKHPLSLTKLESDYKKDYETLYHKAMKTAHLETIDVYFVAPCFLKETEYRMEELKQNPKIIKRPGCNTCTVNYRFRTYEGLAKELLKQAPDTAARTFIINYGRNV